MTTPEQHNTVRFSPPFGGRPKTKQPGAPVASTPNPGVQSKANRSVNQSPQSHVNAAPTTPFGARNKALGATQDLASMAVALLDSVYLSDTTRKGPAQKPVEQNQRPAVSARPNAGERAPVLPAALAKFVPGAKVAQSPAPATGAPEVSIEHDSALDLPIDPAQIDPLQSNSIEPEPQGLFDDSLLMAQANDADREAQRQLAHEQSIEALGLDIPQMGERAQRSPLSEMVDDTVVHEVAPIPNILRATQKEDIPVFDMGGRGIVQPNGLMDVNDSMAPLSSSAFAGAHADVPPGSHYDPWIWDAVSRQAQPDEITVELYADGRMRERMTQMSEKEAFAANRLMPRFDPALHVLMNVKQPKGAPWGDARRVLLVPQTLRVVTPAKPSGPNRYGNNASGGAAAPAKPTSLPKMSDQPTRAAWQADPKAIGTWLARGVGDEVIFGHAMIGEGGFSQAYWVILSKNDAQREHNANRNPHTRQVDAKMGQEGVLPKRDRSSSSGWEDEGALETRLAQPIAPINRYLGHWSDEHAALALRQACALVPGAPTGVNIAGWPKEDVKLVNAEHFALAQRANARANGPSAAIAQPKPEVARPRFAG